VKGGNRKGRALCFGEGGRGCARTFSMEAKKDPTWTGIRTTQIAAVLYGDSETLLSFGIRKFGYGYLVSCCR
jgi:hypothetical protein